MAKFSATMAAEKQLAVQLKRVARVVEGIIEPHIVFDKIVGQAELEKALIAYSQALDPWAEVVAAQSIGSISKNNKRAWGSLSKKLSKGLRDVLDSSSVGAVARKLQDDQVALITSLPIEAGIKAQEMARDGVVKGLRADVTAKKLQSLGEITENRAVLIARTETAKANTALTTARSLSVGATDYIWRTQEDADVRESHAALANKVFPFNNPPFVSEEEGSHAPGDIWNCRCWPEPIIT